MLGQLEYVMPEPSSQHYSLGFVCRQLQMTPQQACHLMRTSEVQFVRMVDDVPYLDGPGFLVVVQAAKKQRGCNE